MKFSRIEKVLRVSVATAAFGCTGVWWARATSGFRDWGRAKPNAVARKTVLAPDELSYHTKMAKIRFVDVIGAYNQRDGELALTEEELKFAQGKIETYEKLAESRTSTGFYGVAYRDASSGGIILAMAGGDYSTGLVPFLLDIDDMAMSTAGGPISQLPDAIKFAGEVREKFGTIDYVTGHSLGGYLALYLAGSGKSGDAQCVVFDSPGVTHAMLHHCMVLGGLSEEQVKRNFRDHTISVTVSPNSYNNLGSQPGIALTRDNEPDSYYSLYPRRHIFADDGFIRSLQETEMLVQRTDDGKSGGPEIVSALLLLTALLSVSREVSRGARKAADAFRR